VCHRERLLPRRGIKAKPSKPQISASNAECVECGVDEMAMMSLAFKFGSRKCR
jgi:hypothetical protein